MWTLSVVAYSLLMFACVAVAAHKFKTVLNPLSYLAFHFSAQTLVAPVLFRSLDVFDMHVVNDSDLVKTIILSAVYMAAISFAFIGKWSPAERIMRCVSPRTMPTVRPLTCVVTLLIALLIFAALMQASGAGLLWLSNPRLAYQTCRSGAGVLWSLCGASLLVSFSCVLYWWCKSRTRVATACLLFAFLAYFLGSKGFVLNYVIFAVLFSHYHIKPMGKTTMAAIGVLVVAGVSGLMLLQGTAGTLMDTLLYFDYFSNTAQFISDFGTKFQHTYGGTTLSELWLYVPRALYPAKPFTYGGSSIMAVYFPDIAEDSGSTPGILNWASSYLDFGLLGVVLSGLFTGYVARAAFEMFRRERTIWGLLVLGQFGMMMGEVTFFRAPFAVFILWLSAQWVLLRVCSISVFRSRTETPRPSPLLVFS